MVSMKNYLARTIVIAGLITLVLGVDLKAQSVTKVVADIPFAFYVGKEKHPEGRYEFEPANRNAFPGALVIRPLAGPDRQAAMVPVITDEASTATGVFSVVFNRYGSTHFLSRVELGGGNMALRLSRTRDERELGRQYERAVTVAIGPQVRKEL
jgi:hypothetical protein